MRNIFMTVFIVALLQGCASTNGNTPMAAQSSYQHSSAPNMDYIYRSPPPQVTRALR